MGEGLDEYIRRNQVHANAVGAKASTTSALARVRGWSRPPLWLINILEGIEVRAAVVAPEMAAHRDEIKTEAYDELGLKIES